MTSETANTTEDIQVLDVRGMRKPDKHPAIFATYSELPVNGAFVLVNDHDPRHLRQEFETDHPGGFDWTYLNREMRDWRIKITKLASTPLPRVLIDTTAVTDETNGSDALGTAWKLQASERDLDSTIIALAPGETIDAHTGPEFDILVHVLAGTGRLTTELNEIELAAGSLMWLPRRSRRQFTAGDQGLRYLTVNQRRQTLPLDSARGGC